MKPLLLFLLLASSSFAYCQQRPNIIVFLVDDMGWQDTSVPFWTKETPLNRRYHTPNMERLAREGMKFTNAYSTPVCTPTRVSLLTGMNAGHHGVTNWTNVMENRSTDKEDEMFAGADWNYNGFSPAPGVDHALYATPFPAILRDNGYFTIHVGKGHWGSMGTPGSNPHNMGFMVNIAGSAIGHPQSYQGKDNYGNLPDKITLRAVHDLTEYYDSDTFLTAALTLEAIKALEAPIDNRQPFYLNMAHYAVHTPLQADDRYYQKYRDAGLDEIEARYASLIEGMDKSLGDLMDYLEEKNVDDNTMIIFTTDNGGLSLTPPRGGTAHTHNLPLRAGKGSVYEGGIRVPMIVKWPGTVSPGATTDQYVIIEDFFPTILEAAGVTDAKTIQPIDGRSFIPLLKNPRLSDNERALIWHHPNKWQREDGPGINYKSAIRVGDWKVVYHLRSGELELFNLQDDIGEQNNLAAKHPEKVRALSRRLSSQLRAWDSPMPVLKSSNRPVPFSDER